MVGLIFGLEIIADVANEFYEFRPLLIFNYQAFSNRVHHTNNRRKDFLQVVLLA